jgi:hypothetical protein
MACPWTPLAGFFQHFDNGNVPHDVRDAFSLLNSEMACRINIGCTRGYVDLKVAEPVFHAMCVMLDQFPGDYEWSVYHDTRCFEYRVLPGTKIASMAVIRGVAYARKMRAEEGEQAMREMLTKRIEYDAVPTGKELERAGGDESGACERCVCTRCGGGAPPSDSDDPSSCDDDDSSCSDEELEEDEEEESGVCERCGAPLSGPV